VRPAWALIWRWKSSPGEAVLLRAEGKGVTGRWGLEEALGEPHDRRNTKRIEAVLLAVSGQNTTKPWLPRGKAVDATGAGGRVSVLTRGDLQPSPS